MKATCPACGSAFDLDAAVSDADARRFADLVAGLDPRVAKPLIQYLALFRPEKIGLRWSRMLSLAEELLPMIREARVQRNGIAYAVPHESWAAALSMLADRPKNLQLPLKSHGYLLEILANQAEKIAAKVERDGETHKRQERPKYVPAGGAAPKAVGAIARDALPPTTDKAVIEQHLTELKGARKK